jgi:nucleoid DNA-binding protein
LLKSEIIKILKKKHKNLKYSQIKSLLEIIFETISKNLINNKAVELRNWGRYSVRTTKAKPNAINPKTQENIYIPEKKKIYFKMSKHLKEEINKE